MSKLYPWLQTSYDHLADSYISQSLHQAVLFTGIAKQGRLDLCRSLAAILLCTSTKPPKPCGVCSGCNLVKAGSHPDLMLIGNDDEDANISIEQIRDMINWLSQKPHQGFNRIVILHQAHRLNIAAANALLKSLEEPPEDTYMLLTSSRPYRLPATIRSRLLVHHLPIPAKDKSIPWLAQTANLSRNQAELILARADGAPLLALQLTQGQDARLRSALQVIIDKFRRGTTASSSLFDSLNEFPPLDVLLLLDNWLSDLIRYSLSDKGISAANVDVGEWIESLSKELQCRAAFRLRDTIWQSVTMIEKKINPNPFLLLINCFCSLESLWKKTNTASKNMQ